MLGHGQEAESRNAAFFKLQMSFKLASKPVAESLLRGNCIFLRAIPKNTGISEVPGIQKARTEVAVPP